jgi:hypothetical protein
MSHEVVSNEKLILASSVATLPGASTAQLSEIAGLQNLSYDDPLAILGSAPFPDEPWWKRVSPSTILVLLAGAIAIFFLLHELLIGGALGFPVDESWIEQVYARNFFRHVSFEFNPGETTAGPTAPLWVVALSVGNGLFHQPMLAAKLLGAVFLFLCGYFIFRLLRSTEQDYGAALLAAILAMTAEQMAWSELSGLESVLSSALVVAGLWWFFESPGGWKRSLTGAIFALAALSRPETSIVFGLLVLYGIVHSDHDESLSKVHRFRDPLLMVMLFGVILVPIGITNVAISGSVVPVTFFAGLARESLPVLLRHGHFAELLLRLFYSFGSIGSIVWDVYLPTNPFFLVTIVGVLILRRRTPVLHKDVSYDLLTFCGITLIAFPYIRAVILGVNDSFGESARTVQFIEGLYVVAGVISIKELVQRFTMRLLSPRQTLYVAATAIVACSVIYLSVRPELTASFMTIKASLDYILLLFFTAVLLSVALAYAGIHPIKPETPSFVTEEERSRYTYSSHDETDGDRAMPSTIKHILRGVLLLSLTWNLTELPRAANDYGQDIRTMRSELAFAGAVSQVTQPSDLIAADKIGALGWSAERRIYDLQGRLTNEPSYNRRMLGDRGILQSILDAKARYVAILSIVDNPTLAQAVRQEALKPIKLSHSFLPTLYEVDVQKLSSITTAANAAAANSAAANAAAANSAASPLTK